ncbi:GNAT family N-acetyltransferase [Streptomyces sp. NPDC091027]|uniref:GNAT family N-acetyltransferase n=1 Tax=Streptomyces sp. NPDC091027 TaxID=3365971 RepID=UPI00382575F8
MTLRPDDSPMETGPDASLVVRRFAEKDPVEDLTGLFHRAYADHAAAGRIFFASYQSSQDTANRLGKGECWVACRGDALVGTVTVAAPHPVPEGYPAPATAGSFWQLAVDPSERGTGLGQRLLDLAEKRIMALGSAQAVIDTSAEAAELVGWYRRRGYVQVGTWRWNVTNLRKRRAVEGSGGPLSAWGDAGDGPPAPPPGPVPPVPPPTVRAAEASARGDGPPAPVRPEPLPASTPRRGDGPAAGMLQPLCIQGRMGEAEAAMPHRQPCTSSLGGLAGVRVVPAVEQAGGAVGEDSEPGVMNLISLVAVMPAAPSGPSTVTFTA